ncbi:MAG TPA: oxidoreductase [Mucilaginibacter sp.]|jgi:NAD(P)-dependent dehydrogenase (short-subunit alcohol dehydrogenase family)|nr:oxidoreductase [Mucilaginibacter sp.]
MQDYSTEFAGKRVLVTGGSRGIGAAAAQRLIDGGAKVVVTARSRHEETPANATFISGDLRTKESAEAVAKEAISILDGLDVLIHSAGAARVQLTSIDQIAETEWLDSLDINFLAGLRITHAVLPALKASGKAAIVYVSAGGLIPFGTPLAHYGAAKAALNNYAQNLAKELAPAGIRVNVVTPGPIITPGGDEVRNTITGAMGITDEQFFAGVPLQGRGGKAEELAEPIAFLVSDRASYITGHNHFVTGGWGELV